MVDIVTISKDDYGRLTNNKSLSLIGCEQYTYVGIISVVKRRLRCLIAGVIYDTWTDYQAMRAHPGVFAAKTRVP